MNKSLKITLIAVTPTGWHQQDLARAAQERGAEFEVLDIKSANELSAKAKRFGDVVIWRATSGLDRASERTSVKFYFEDRPVMNRAVFDEPYITHKYYQQRLLAAKLPDISGIPTYRADSGVVLRRLIARGKLSFPFIAKPNLGSKGKGIVVVEGEEGLAGLNDHKNFVFQNFLKNAGDWRVIVVGGRALGVMRRIAKKGSYLNNISQGAKAVEETRPEVRKEVIDIALYAAAAFGLAYCGVDIIQDEQTGTYHFLEVNTAPQWNGDFGFAAITGVDVAGEIIDLAIDLAKQHTGFAPELVQDYYDRYIEAFPSKAVHYASRMYLWTHEQKYRDMLDSLEATYLGATDKAAAKRLKTIFEKENQVRRSQVVSRRHSMEKYPFLQAANRLLFKVLFARTLYGRNFEPQVAKLVPNERFLELFTQLRDDPEALCSLSTFAVNFLFLLKNYFALDVRLSNEVLLSPEFFARLLDRYEVLVTEGKMTPAQAAKLKVYLVTHVIIGESRFYARPVRDPGYRELLKQAEGIVGQHYFDLPIDTRLEFLVAAKICGYQSPLAPVILHEASRSFSPLGNFIIDRFNTGGSARRERLCSAEHRNVLYLMASRPFVKRIEKSASPPALKTKERPVVGRMAEVDFPQQGLSGVLARVDSGASLSAVHAREITEHNDGSLSFELFGDYSATVPAAKVRVESFKKMPVKNTSGTYEVRYTVDLPVMVKGQKSTQTFTLADRSAMGCPVLLGRTFLKRRYLVDMGRKF